MKHPEPHNFHVPVMGTGFTIDTPISIARYGISSVISLVDDVLIEKIRRHYCTVYKKPYTPITDRNEDPRAERITAYLNLVNEIVEKQIEELKKQTFDNGSELRKYFELLPETSSLKEQYYMMIKNSNPEGKRSQQQYLKKRVTAGSIDVNIMTTLDNDNYKNNKKLSPEYSDAFSALRGYANSNVCSGIVFSAGINRGLYSYIEQFNDFYPQPDGQIKKKIIIKVSDYRSAVTQGKFLARKGLWVSEFRIESGLNCGGHAFATKGLLIGPVLEEFKEKKNELLDLLLTLFNKGLQRKEKTVFDMPPPTRITAQGGISTAHEHAFLLDYYNVDATGWGTPFLMVPEATSVDEETLQKLAAAKEEDIRMSQVSPINIIFQNLCTSASEVAKQVRIQKGIPGSACPKGFLVGNTEFTEKPVCAASRQYQKQKIEQLKSEGLSPQDFKEKVDKIVQKSCICHELGGAALIKHKLDKPENVDPAICPGPNMIYFSRTYSFVEMVAHIYGTVDLLGNTEHPNMFITELRLYIDVLKHKIAEYVNAITEKEIQYIKTFYENVCNGIEYYNKLLSSLIHVSEHYKEKMAVDLLRLGKCLEQIIVAYKAIPVEL